MKGQHTMFSFMNKKMPIGSQSNPAQHSENASRDNPMSQEGRTEQQHDAPSTSRGRLKKKKDVQKQELEESQFVVPEDPKPQADQQNEQVQYERFVVGSLEEQTRKKQERDTQKALEKKERKSKKGTEAKPKPMTEQQKKRLKQEAKRSRKEKPKQNISKNLRDQIEGSMDLNSDEEDKIKMKTLELTNEKTQIDEDFELAQKLALEEQLEYQKLKNKKQNEEVPKRLERMSIHSPVRQTPKPKQSKKGSKSQKKKIQQPRKSSKKQSKSKSKSKSRSKGRSKSPQVKPKKMEEQKLGTSQDDDQKNQKPFEGKTIVFTGDFKHDRSRIEGLMSKLGARITGSVSGKTSFLLQGYASPDGKPISMTNSSRKAADLKIPIIAHDSLQGFFKQWTGKTLSQHLNIKQKQSKPKVLKPQTKPTGDKFTLWCQKYIPTSLDDIIGQQAAISKARVWLEGWEDVHRKGIKHNIKKPYTFFYPVGDLNSKAMLFSGSPGLGKTTVARLLGAEYGYRVVQYNASDARNKANVVLMQTGSYSMSFSKEKQKILMILDQVDGLSGGDRGGSAAMIQMIKKSLVPIICICNDRQNQKIKSLGGHCYDVVFTEPTKQEIMNRLVNILTEEGVKYDKTSLLRIIQTFNGDIRQILNFLNLYCMSQKNISTNKNNALTAQGFAKDDNVMLDMWSASNKLLNRVEFKSMNMRERLDLFFVDFQFVPLIVQNCLRMSLPKRKLKNAQMMNFVKACDFISFGDVINRSIRRYQEWKLMPMYGLMSSVFPTEVCSQSGKAVFPKWLGNNSKTKKISRELKELQAAFRKVASGGRKSTKDYAKTLHYLIHHHLRDYDNEKEKGKKVDKDEQCGLNRAVALMNAYRITPDFLKEHMADVQLRNGDLLNDISTAVKSALTRTFNERFNASKTTFAKTKANPGQQVSKYDPLMQEIIVEDEPIQEQQASESEEVIVQKPKGKSKPAKKASKVQRQSSGDESD